MSKKILAVALAIVMLISLSISVCAYTDQYVLDFTDSLAYSEKEEMELKAEQIENTYGYSVMLCITDETVSESYAKEIYEDYSDSANGIILVHDTAANVYYHYITDSAKDELDSEIIADLQTAYDSDDSYFGGIEAYYNMFETVLGDESNIIPVPDNDNYAMGDGLVERKADTAKGIVICIVAGFAIGFLVMFAIASKNKSVKMQKNATVYTRQGSFVVTGNYDNFLYKNVDKIPKPKQNNSK